ncbi:hypothetical protein [Clostridium sp.]|uniref:hypothetical protein n=1 Tax=Clostridium sp. TaxID=1506 RepID=UPI003216B7DF
MDKKYYWISYVYKNTRNNDVGFANTVTTTHPFKDKLFKKSDGYGYYEILNFKEILEEEYEMFKE